MIHELAKMIDENEDFLMAFDGNCLYPSAIIDKKILPILQLKLVIYLLQVKKRN